MSERLVLIDTSVWIDYLRNGHSPISQVLDQLLSSGPAAICEPVKAEIISGAPTKAEFHKLRELLASVLTLDVPKNIWEQIGEHRFLLARKGVQASLVDLWIAVAAKENNALLWTLDKDFLPIAQIFHVELFRPSSSA